MITFPSIEKISTCYNIDIFDFGLFPLVSLMEKIPQQQLFLPKFESSFVNKKYLDDQPAEFAKSHICSVCICNPQIYFPLLVFFLDSMGWKMIHSTVNKIVSKKWPFLVKRLYYWKIVNQKFVAFMKKFTSPLVCQFTTTCSKIRRA